MADRLWPAKKNGKGAIRTVAEAFFVPPEDVLARLEAPDLVLLDARFDLLDPAAGRRAYEREHLPGARYIDLERDASAPPDPRAGRHPLPPWPAFAARLGDLGVGPDGAVVVYDDHGGGFAGRIVWMLRAIGHERAAVLSVPFSVWKARGYPTTAERPVFRPKPPYPLSAAVRPEAGFATTDDIRRLVAGEAFGVLIDARDPERYLGLSEPIDPVAGHIPGALNVPYAALRDPDTGEIAAPERLQDVFRGLPADRPAVVYCGSGVTSAIVALALRAAGWADVRVYAGSYSAWVGDPLNPIARGAAAPGSGGIAGGGNT
ncbi:MAG: Thiosulfate sulfurtransferase, rhodanese [Hydrogenibacillus schlegelii]|uniref:Thiosulfate sulfurtransferase, rhodanese n=1 Tax=Hydrogenibacillus schlegelii TaxID=1484 RepID=A0A2T5G5T6_HYDSH|nr:MAG: Thiosulfate sulfurtransferase, rhodanese [Hydrogenibacillus schlegelii]